MTPPPFGMKQMFHEFASANSKPLVLQEVVG